MPEPIERSALGNLDLIDEGGQGTLYLVRKRGVFGQPAVFKEYKPETLQGAGFDAQALRAMVDFLDGLSFRDGTDFIGQAAWPAQLVVNNARLCGFVMAKIPEDFYIQLKLVTTKRRVTAEFQHILSDEEALVLRGLSITDRDRYELLKVVAQTLAYLHAHQIVVGDLSASNILFSLRPVPRCMFVDCDSMVLNGVSAVDQPETPMWRIRDVSPEPLATFESDCYKFGLLTLRLLARSQTAKTAKQLPASVPSPLRYLVECALSRSPSDRLLVDDRWIDALGTAAKTASTRRPQRAAPSGVPPRPAPPKPPVVAPPPTPPPPTPPPPIKPFTPLIPPKPPIITPTPVTGPAPKRLRGVYAGVGALVVIGGIVTGVAVSGHGSPAGLKSPTVDPSATGAAARATTCPTATATDLAARKMAYVSTPRLASAIQRARHPLFWWNVGSCSFVSVAVAHEPPTSATARYAYGPYVVAASQPVAPPTTNGGSRIRTATATTTPSASREPVTTSPPQTTSPTASSGTSPLSGSGFSPGSGGGGLKGSGHGT